ncbi:MAG: class I SAM-dependent methyltransferase [Cyanobacteria bacterium]|nr:class I SAM-dependent methyltransferase [Cyanobacteriota bacterium]
MAEIAQKCLREWQRGMSKLFPFWQQLGLHVVPNHFYQPIPDTRELRDDLWERRSELVGIDMRESAQIAMLDQFVSSFKKDYDSIPLQKGDVQQYYVNNNTLASVDGEILYCMIRQFKPRRILEIGSGYSTLLSAETSLKNKELHGTETELTAIEPYPNKWLKAGFPGLSRLVEKKVQDVDLSEFTSLEDNDILFIDSSHVLKLGSDVQYEYLEILPRLRKGVLVHIHDIFLPSEYPREWIFKHLRFWNEQYLLQAFLTHNSAFEVVWGGSFMHLKHSDRLAKAFRSYSPKTTWPGSFWIRRV